MIKKKNGNNRGGKEGERNLVPDREGTWDISALETRLQSGYCLDGGRLFGVIGKSCTVTQGSSRTQWHFVPAQVLEELYHCDGCELCPRAGSWVSRCASLGVGELSKPWAAMTHPVLTLSFLKIVQISSSPFSSSPTWMLGSVHRWNKGIYTETRKSLTSH